VGAGQHQLVAGNNKITVDVIAENGSNIKTYNINVTRGSTSGVEDFQQPPVVAYPNPASNQITVNGLSGNGILSVFDAVGRERIRQTITSSQEIIAVNALPAGIYLIRIIEGNKTNTIKVIWK
jgi:hypothetical protein